MLKNFIKNPSSWQFALGVTLIWRAIVTVIAIFGYFLLPARYAPLDLLAPIWQKNFLFWSAANFDGRHYLTIASQGYGYADGFPLFAFFPFYPLLLKSFSFFFGKDLFLAGQAIIFLFLPLLIFFGNKWLSLKEYSKKEILMIDFLFLFFPGAIFLNAFYTELPFLLFLILSFYFLEQKKYGWASFWAALASATRLVGIFLVPIIFWQILRDKKVNPLKKIGFPLLSSSGLLFYMLYLGINFANPFLFGFSQASWGRPTAIVLPTTTFLNYLKTIFFPPESLSFLNYYVVLLEFFLTLLALASFFSLWLKSCREKTISPVLVFSTLAFLLPLLNGFLSSMPRYLMASLALFPYWAEKINQKGKKTKGFIYAIIFLVFSSGVILFTRGYWWG